MQALPGDEQQALAVAEAGAAPEFSVLKQRVDLDIDFAHQALRGSTEISIQPLVKGLKHIRLHCRQCRPTAIQAGGITARWEFEDPYRRSHMDATSTVQQYEMLRSRIERSLQPVPEPELVITLPTKLKIQELALDPSTALPQYDGVPSLKRQENDALAVVEAQGQSAITQQGPQFAPIKLYIEFELNKWRDGLQWVGCASEDKRFPYVYTKVEPWAGNTSCIFPCMDDANSRCSWEISIRCPRTLGDAFRSLDKIETSVAVQDRHSEDIEMTNGTGSSVGSKRIEPQRDDFSIDLSQADAALDLTVLCTGALVEDVPDSEDETRHMLNFSLPQSVTARHFGFAIGPFEQVDLSDTRNSEEEERLGQSAVKVTGFCLPDRGKELRNTCLPIAWATDFFGVNYGAFPFHQYQMVFIDDFIHDTVATAGLAFCSSDLLFPKSIIEPIDQNTRILIRALAEQWIGVNIIPMEAIDSWVVAGIAGFMTDSYMKKLAGNNEFRWKQKLAAEKVYELDVDRPSIQKLGELLHLDKSIRDFVNLKSALVLFILDRRLMKASGTTGVNRIISKIFLNAKTGTLVNGEISTNDFQRTCERLGHNKLESFFRQWVFLSGCPIFHVTQRFNKKKLVVEMTIVQRQLERQTKPLFEPSNFMREVREHVQEIWAPEPNAVFTGPMTIRIHEADGTPYEHIVEIKEPVTKLEIPYNTKYKRLKRSRRQKERQMAEGPTNVEGGDDALLYCLGDILDTEEERRDWNLREWTEEDEEKMGQESYEWIRMDADFEWIGKIHLVLPLYMYVSQLQQDRDIVAQYDSMRYLLGSNPHHVNLTILVRTLMDTRYFWGIREMAAKGLATCATAQVFDIGMFHLLKAFKELFFIADDNLPKPNDFSDRRDFIMQCAIARSMAMLRDSDGKVPMQIRKFFIDLLRFNDNTTNRLDDGDPDHTIISDCHYIATLMNCLADSVIASHREIKPSYDFSFGDDEPMLPIHDPDYEFAEIAIEQIDRHRRIDEWDPSYHNIYSTTALECLERLANAGIAKKNSEIMKYVRRGNADNVRVVAYRCLSEIGVLANMPAMQYMLSQLVEDPSPSFRHRLFKIFGEALGHIALGQAGSSAKPVTQAPAEAGLILEQEPSSDERRRDATRKTSPEGAISALKFSLEGEVMFGNALWYATTSDSISLDEIAAFCNVAALIFEPVTSRILSMQLPRMYRCHNVGRGKIKFIPSGPHRTAPRKNLADEDWQTLQKLGLKYTGPVPAELLQKQEDSQRNENAASLKLQIAQAQRDIQQAQESFSAGSFPTPTTPSAEKTGIKLNLAGKRKQSFDMGRSNGTIKALKLQRRPSTSSTGQMAKDTPSIDQGQANTSGAATAHRKPKGKLIVVLRFQKNQARAQQILSKSPAAAQRNSAAQSTPRVLTQPPFPMPSLVQSPQTSINLFRSNNAFSPPPQPAAMNFGGFRSYGPSTDSSPQGGDVKTVENHQGLDNTSSPTSLSLSALPRPSSLSSSPPRAPSTEETGPMGPPPKPLQRTLTLKLGRKLSETKSSE